MRAADALRFGRRRSLDADVAGLDRLDLPIVPARNRWSRWWEAIWPKLGAIAIVVGVWQLIVVSGLKPEYALPGPLTVAQRLVEDIARDSELPAAVATTLRRSAIGFGMAILGGVALGLAIARFKRLRVAVGSLISGLQTMPSIAWFPLAILVFGLSETAIVFVVVLGAAPAIANGLLTGIDHIPRILLRAGRILGARRVAWYRHVVIPAALPSFVGGLKQGWAFAWRSLMAGELLVIIAGQPSIGVRLAYSREVVDAPGLMATMVVILVIGIVVDEFLFGTVDRSIRRRWGLL